MRNLIATAQLIILTVVAISIMREFKHAEAGRNQRMQLLQSLTEPPATFCVPIPPLPTT